MEQDNRIDLYNTEDMTRMSRPVDSGRQIESQGVADYLAKRVEAGKLLNGDRLALKQQLTQESGITPAIIWCTVVPRRCSDSFGLTRVRDSTQGFSMPLQFLVRLKIRLCRPWWATPPSGPPTMVKYLSSRRKLVWNNRLIQAKQKTAAQLPSRNYAKPLTRL